MGATKNYLLRISEVSEDLEEQDAIEWAIYAGLVKLTYDVHTDQGKVQQRLPELLEAYRRQVRDYEHRRAA